MGCETTPDEGRRGTDVMAALDRSGAATRFLIADVGRDEAWLSMRGEEAPDLEAWR